MPIIKPNPVGQPSQSASGPPQPTRSTVPTWNDSVTTCDGLAGRISFVWKKIVEQATRLYYRVSFPPGSPYLDDWAVYRQTEVTLCPPKPQDPPSTP